MCIMARKIRGLSDEKLRRVIVLRETGSSWVKIQEEVGIDRRTAKRAYEDWERNQSREELKAARKDVAAGEFRNHLHSLIKLAESLLNTLDIPSSPNTTMSAEEVLLNLWQRDIAGEYGAYGLSGGKPETSRILRQNQMLFKSLRAHTHEKDWQTFDEWGNSWDTCIRILAKLRREARETLLNILNQKSNLTDRIVKGCGKKDAVKRMVDGVLHVVWQFLLAGKPDQQFPLVQAMPVGGGRIEVTFGQYNLTEGLIFTEADLAEQVITVCKWAAKNLCIGRKDDMVEPLMNNVNTMRKSIEELAEMLNPLKLGPMILNTRCDLCPA
jgi:hypothetical protein